MGVFDITEAEVPAIRIAKAVGKGAEKNLLFVVGGGIGDRICAEPTLRYAIDTFRDCSISLMCQTPELFSHLKFDDVYVPIGKIEKEYFPLYTYPIGNLANQFFNANLMNPVDFASVSALRMQLPVNYRRPKQPFSQVTRLGETVKYLYQVSNDGRHILLHPGKTWPSRTVPSFWWEEVIEEIYKTDFYHPVLIGNKTVDIKNSKKCLDTRDKLTLQEVYWLCSYSNRIITNDSSPMHMAAPGNGKIAYISTVRHPDLLLHCRDEFGKGMRDFSKNRPWELFNHCPNNLSQQRIDVFPDGKIIEDYLCTPKEVVQWLI